MITLAFISGLVLGFVLCVILNKAFYKYMNQNIQIIISALDGVIDKKSIDKIVKNINK